MTDGCLGRNEMTDDEFDNLQAEYDLCGVDGRLRDFAEAVLAAERERCAKMAAPEHIPFSDDEWRVRCELSGAGTSGDGAR